MYAKYESRIYIDDRSVIWSRRSSLWMNRLGPNTADDLITFLTSAGCHLQAAAWSLLAADPPLHDKDLHRPCPCSCPPLQDESQHRPCPCSAHRCMIRIYTDLAHTPAHLCLIKISTDFAHTPAHLCLIKISTDFAHTPAHLCMIKISTDRAMFLPTSA